MDDSIEIRNAERDEIAAILNMVGEIACETYGYLFTADTPVPVDPEPWKHCWIAIVDDRIVGVVLAAEDHVEDLWLLKQYRGRGIGSQLLARAELEISNAGFTAAKLRVVADNEPARSFYKTRGWTDIRYYQHEEFRFEMVNMKKCLSN